jgi:hypothetical protein
MCEYTISYKNFWHIWNLVMTLCWQSTSQSVVWYGMVFSLFQCGAFRIQSFQGMHVETVYAGMEYALPVLSFNNYQCYIFHIYVLYPTN